MIDIKIDNIEIFRKSADDPEGFELSCKLEDSSRWNSINLKLGKRNNN